MASRLYDSLNRNPSTTAPVALGTSDSGHPWVDLSSPGGAVTVLDNAARADPAAALALAVLDAGADGGDGEVGITIRTGVGRPGSGLAAYFRCVDAANWWRAYQRVYSYQYQTGTETYVSGYTQVYVGEERYVSGYTQVEYEWRQNYSTGITHDYQDTYGIHYQTAWSTSSSTAPFFGSISHAHYLSGSYYPGDDSSHGHSKSGSPYRTGAQRGGDPIYSTRSVYQSQPIYSTRATYATATGYDLRLERMVAGALSTRASRQISGPFSSIGVAFSGDKIDAYVGGVLSPVSTVDTAHMTATRHGLGRGKPSEFESINGDLIDSFYFNPVRAGSLMPPVMP